MLIRPPQGKKVLWQEMLRHDAETALRQQEVNVRHPPMLTVLDRDRRAPRPSRFHCVDRVLEREARQR